MLEKMFHHDFVHSRSGAKDSGSYTRNASEFAKALDGPIFSERAVEDREYHVDSRLESVFSTVRL